MMEKINVKITKKGEVITVSNSLGKKWTYSTNDASGLVCALVANSCYEFFRHFDDTCGCFAMSLTVSKDVE